ncbi:MAG: hypothetical protein EOM14_05815 [Clostridia bacterium]|nr:hypothetical protein [Clostridia bacterium]
MLLLFCVVLGFAIALACGGQLTRIVRLRGLLFPIIALALSSICGYIPTIPYIVKLILTTFSYFFSLAFAVMNRRYLLGSTLTFVGTLSNFVVIAANEFRMPISEYALVYYPDMTAEAVVEKSAAYFVAVNGNARLLILGDVICVPIAKIGGFISVGDVFLALGVMTLIVYALAPDKLNSPIKRRTPHH